MSYLDTLRAAKIAPITVYDQFIRDEARISDGVFVFLEGKTDKPFYDIQLIKYYTDTKKIFYYVGDNRKGVIDLHSKVGRRNNVHEKNINIFIIDKDLNDFNGIMPNDHNIFITPTYSFENSLIDKRGLSLLWDSGIQTAKTGIHKTDVARKFKYALFRFYIFMRRFFAYVIYQRIRGKNAILQNVKINQIFSICDSLNIEFSQNALSEIVKQSDLNPIHHKSKPGISIVEQRLKVISPKCYTRGKFELALLRIFLDRLYKIGKTLDPSFSYNFEISDRGLINYIAPRIDLPKEFKNFLDSVS